MGCFETHTYHSSHNSPQIARERLTLSIIRTITPYSRNHFLGQHLTFSMHFDFQVLFTRNVAVTEMHWCEYTPPAAAGCRARSSAGMSDKLQVNRASTRESASFVAPESVLLLVAWRDTAYFVHRSSSERTFWQGAPPGDYKDEIQSCRVYLPRRHGPCEELAKCTSLPRRQMRRMFSVSLFSNNLPWPESVGV